MSHKRTEVKHKMDIKPTVKHIAKNHYITSTIQNKTSTT